MSDTVDWAEWVDEQRKVSEADCARLRRALAGRTITLSELLDERFGVYSRSAVSKHANGKCTHDHGVPPVKRVCRWETRER